jgi:hypothetical protein
VYLGKQDEEWWALENEANMIVRVRAVQDSDGNGNPDECDYPGDLDGDRDVDLADLAELLSHYGTPSGANYEQGDLDFDGDVDLADLAALLAFYGTTYR